MTEQELIELWGDGQMSEQQLIELWGDGTQFGMNTEMVGALNNAFREVAIKFALVVADKAYGAGFEEGRYGY
jgi:hypothetical protein